MRSTLRADVWRAIEGRATVTGRIGHWRSECLVCGLDSGPWRLRFEAAVSGLIHLNRHHNGGTP